MQKADHTPQGRFSQTTGLCIINTCATHLIKRITAAEMLARLKSEAYFQRIIKKISFISEMPMWNRVVSFSLKK